MERSIILSDTLANRLKHYLQEHPNERVSDLIEEILQQKKTPVVEPLAFYELRQPKLGVDILTHQLAMMRF